MELALNSLRRLLLELVPNSLRRLLKFLNTRHVIHQLNNQFLSVLPYPGHQHFSKPFDVLTTSGNVFALPKLLIAMVPDRLIGSGFGSGLDGFHIGDSGHQYTGTVNLGTV